MMNVFSLKLFLKENKLTSKLLAEKTGYNKNTLTTWSKSDTDKKLPQDFVLKLLQEFPDANLAKYFPTYAEIIKLSNKSK